MMDMDPFHDDGHGHRGMHVCMWWPRTRLGFEHSLTRLAFNRSSPGSSAASSSAGRHRSHGRLDFRSLQLPQVIQVKLEGKHRITSPERSTNCTFLPFPAWTGTDERCNRCSIVCLQVIRVSQLCPQTARRLRGFQWRAIVPAQIDGVRGSEQNWIAACVTGFQSHQEVVATMSSSGYGQKEKARFHYAWWMQLLSDCPCT